MIKSNELRVGNIIRDYNGTVREVNGRDIFEQWWYDGEPNDGSLGAPLNPIDLTDEWLEKMGMIWKSVPDSDGSEHNIYTATWGNFDLVMFDNWVLQVESIRMPHIKYVHQLQNLYHSLTGEELPINLERKPA